MDGNKARRAAPPPAGTGGMHLLERCWRLRAPSGRIVTCAIYPDRVRGVEVRVEFDGDELVRSQWTVDLDSGRDIAREWRLKALATHGYREVT